nr:uncharacterized protein LOC112789225 [Arachis hypogaea]
MYRITIFCGFVISSFVAWTSGTTTCILAAAFWTRLNAQFESDSTSRFILNLATICPLKSWMMPPLSPLLPGWNTELGPAFFRRFSSHRDSSGTSERYATLLHFVAKALLQVMTKMNKQSCNV